MSVTTTFTKEFHPTDSTRESPSRFISPHNSPAPSAGGELDTRAGNVNIYVLPPQKRVLHYVTLYFQNTNILFPYLHQPSFLETYEGALRDGFSKVRRTWLALLNLVMAMGSRASTETDTSTEEKYKTAEVFYQRGFGLCDGHFLRLASLDSGEASEIVFGWPTELMVNSTLAAANEPLPSEHTEAESMLDYTRVGCTNSITIRITFKSSLATVPALGERTEKKSLVWLCLARQVSRLSGKIST